MYFLSISILAQSDFFKNYDGIPITAIAWGREGGVAKHHFFNDIDEAGIDAFVACNISDSLYNFLRANDTRFKLIPYMHFWMGRHSIAYYSTRGYTVWEAEGSTEYDVKLSVQDGILAENSTSVKNNPSLNSACDLLSGPNYYCVCAIEPFTEKDSIPVPIKYTVDYKLKIDWRNGIEPSNLYEMDYEDDHVCKLAVTSTDENGVVHELASKILRIKDMFPINTYKTFSLKYNEDSKSVYTNLLKNFEKVTPDGIKWWVGYPFVEYKVYWYNLSYLDLYVDKIVDYNEPGKQLFEKNFTPSDPLWQEINFTIGDPYNRNEVVGWYPFDEPEFIHMQSCVKTLDELIHYYTSELHLMPGFACGWNDQIGETSGISKIGEYAKRGNYNGSFMHKYLYDDPYTPVDNPTGYKKDNITCYIDNINNYNDADPNFITSIQSGIWANDSAHIRRKVFPSPIQFTYNINLALLYGTKGIDINDYYYCMDADQDTVNRKGMVGYYLNSTAGYVKYYSPIWYTLRDSISPRLKGSYGKLLKKLQQHSQGQLLNQSSITIDNIQFSRNGIASIDDARDYDCGTFIMPESAGDKKYFMIVSRYYQGLFTDTSPTSINFICSNLSERNYTVKEHYYNTNSHCYATNNAITFNKSLKLGSALLFEVMPAIRYGGYIIGNETISSSQSLLEHLTINSNQQLSVSGSNTVYSLTDTVTIQSNASINCSLGGKINAQNGYIQFVGTGRIIFDNWYNSLFYTSENGHPKLIWGYQAGPKTYHVYKYTGGSWVNIANISTTTKDITHKQYYVDTDEEIYSGANYIRYKVIEGTSNETNEVSIHVLPKEFVEGNEQVSDFQVEQNYPNPFNPTTTIGYSIPNTGRVSIKLYDMLGREVKDIFEGIQAMGSYNIEVNCNNLASGVYIYKIQYNDKMLSKKMILQK